MPLHNSSFTRTAKSIQAYLYQEQNPDWRRLSSLIYNNLMTAKLTRKVIEKLYGNGYEEYGSLFTNTIESLEFNVPVKIGHNRLWQTFDFENIYSIISTPKRILQGFHVTYKEYFSFHPTNPKNIEVVVREILEFIRCIPPILNRLYPLCYEKKDPISLKIINSLHEFIRHPDSMVIHFRRKSTGKHVRKIIREELKKRKLMYYERKNKPESGFDFATLEDEQKKETGSHSQILSHIIAKSLIEYYHENTQKSRSLPTVDELKDVLKSLMNKIKKWSPEDVAKYLKTH